MSIQITIPDAIVQAMRLPEQRVAQEVVQELAVALYARELLSFGKARELAGVGKDEFGQMLGARGVYRHYGREELEDDLTYARGE